MDKQLECASKYANQSLEQIIGLNLYVSSGEFAKKVYEDYILHLQKMFNGRGVMSNHAISSFFFCRKHRLYPKEKRQMI